jgi:MFS family permease
MSQFGDEITMLALPWLLAESTASPLAVGALEAFLFLPVVVFGLQLGVIADRRSRRISLMQADVLRFVMLMSIASVAWFWGGPYLAHILVAVFVIGTAHALFEASAQAFLTDLVPIQAIVRANARLSFTEGLCIVAGPAIAGLLIAFMGASGAIAIDALTFALSFVALLLIGRRPETFSATREPMRAAMGDGFRAIKSQPLLRALMEVIACSNIGAAFVTALAVFYFQRTLHLEGWQAGVVYSVNGIGAIAASLVIPRLSTRIGLGRTVVVGVVIAGVGAALLPLATQRTWFVFATLSLTLIGFGVVSLVVASTSIRQRLVPGELLGRVTASYRTVVNGALVIGALIGGTIGQFVGLRVALGTGAAIYGVAVIFALSSALNAPDSPELSAET